MSPEKFLSGVFRAIGQERDSQKIFLAREFNRVIEQLRAVTFALVLLMDDEIFEQRHKTALRGADCEQQIDHSHDRTFASQHEHAAAARLFEN